MGYFFENYPTVEYTFGQSNIKMVLSNVTVRFKIAEILRNKAAVLYDYNVKDGERPDIIADKYYDDPTLDWLILLVNNIIDPHFEWPLDDRSFDNYIKKKYGSREKAKQTILFYRKILREQSVLYDGTIIPKKTLIVDYETYVQTPLTEREVVYAYDYELEKNDKRAEIKILDRRYKRDVVGSYEAAIDELNNGIV